MESPTVWKTEREPEEEQVRDDEEEDEDEGDEAITKRLVFDCAETPLKPDLNGGGGVGARRFPANTKNRSVVIYLRIRPKSQREIMSMDASCLHLVNQKELQAVAPTTSQTYKNKTGTRCPGESTQQFSFTHIFDETASQREVFEEALVPTLKDFLNGQNCLVFIYGVTNSGKTYTVTGTQADPGVLPRSLDLIFNSVTPQQMSSLNIQPKNFSEVLHISEEEAESQRIRREAIWNKARGLSEVEELGETTTDLSGNISTISKASSNYSKVSDTGASLCEIRVDDGSTIDLESGDTSYTFWVSFCEIYNEFTYDLLADEEPEKRRGRPALKVAEDSNHNHFIKGLVEVKVESTEEAMLLLKMGQRHRHVASTCLNYQSSRSHTIFTVKIIKVPAGMERPHKAFVNRISIVDLAGAERSKETGARGMRVREAGNINTSLLTLGKCIEAMKHNQNRRRREEHIVPFRESKLTQLFQNYFVGKGKGVRQGKITMLVNVSNNASVFDETSHVLKFSALTSKIIPTVKEVVARSSSRPRPPPSSRVLRSATARTPAVLTASSQRPTKTQAFSTKTQTLSTIREEGQMEETKRTVSLAVCEHCEERKEEVRELRGKLSALEVAKMEMEYKIRQEVCREFQEQITEIEEAHREELEEQAEEMQVMCDRRMKLLQKSMKKEYNRKRRRVETQGEEDEEEEEGRGIESRLRDMITRLEEELEMEREKKVALSAELKDGDETHQSKMTLLNQQVNGVSLRAAEAEKQVQELKEKLSLTVRREEERTAALERELKSAQSERTRAEEEATLARENKEKIEKCCNELRLEMDKMNTLVNEKEREVEERSKELQLKVEKMAISFSENEREMESLQEDRLSLIAEYETREGQLRDEITGLKTQLEQNSQTVSECARREREAEEKVIAAEARREDAVTEEEILQARISELTRELELRSLAKDAVGESGGVVSLLQEKVLELESKLKLKASEVDSLQKTNQLASESSSAELSAVQQELAVLSNQLAERDEMIDSLRAAAMDKEKLWVVIKTLSREVTAVGTELESTKSNLMKSCREYNELIQRLTVELTNERDILQGGVDRLQSQLNTKEERVTQLLSELESYQDLETEHHQQRSELELELEGMKTSHAKSLEELKKANTEYQEELAEVKQTHIKGLEELEEKKQALCTMQKELADITASRDKTLLELAGLKTAYQQKLEKADVTANQKLSELNTAFSQAQHQLEELNSAYSEAQEELANTKSAHGTVEQQLSELRERHQDELRELSTANQKIEEELAQTNTTHNQEMEKMKMIHSTMEHELATLKTAHQEQLKEMKTAHMATEKELEKMKDIHKQEIEKMKLAQSALQEELARACEAQKQLTNTHLQELAQVKSAHSAIEHEMTELHREKMEIANSHEMKLKDLTSSHSSAMAELKQNHEQELTGLKTARSALEEELASLKKKHCDVAFDDVKVETVTTDEEPTSTASDTHTETTDSQTENERVLSPPLSGCGLPRSDSKPFVPVLDCSSQLVEEEDIPTAPRIIIDATPPAARKGRRGRKHKTETKDLPVTEEEEPPKRRKYGLRDRSKHRRFESQDSENKIPRYKALVNQVKLNKEKKILGNTQPPPTAPPPLPLPHSPSSSPIIPRPLTRETKSTRRIRKSQISGPLQLLGSPAHPPTSRSLAGIGPPAPPLYHDRP